MPILRQSVTNDWTPANSDILKLFHAHAQSTGVHPECDQCDDEHPSLSKVFICFGVAHTTFTYCEGREKLCLKSGNTEALVMDSST